MVCKQMFAKLSPRINLILMIVVLMGISALADGRELISGRYLNAKRNLIKNDEKSRKVLDILFQLAMKQKKISVKRNILSNEALGAEERVRDSLKKTIELKDKIHGRSGFLKKRVRTAYMMSGDGIFRLLFSSGGFHELYENMKFSGLILKNDVRWIDEQRMQLKELRKREAHLKIQLGKYKKLANSLKEKKRQLDKIQNLRVKVLRKIKKNRARNLYSIHQMRSLSDELGLKEYGLDVFETAFFEKKGKMSWPVQAKIKQGYGVIKNKEFGFSWKQKGIYFTPQNSQVVRSVFKGKVAYVGDVLGIGLTVILSHGDHYFTVYGRNRQVRVKLGDVVESEKVIARSAKTGRDLNRHLGAYFEVRHFSDALNPMEWLDKTKLRL